MGDDDDKPRGQFIIDQPGMTSVVTKEYLVLPFTDVVVHKKVFAWWTLIMFLFTSAIWIVGFWTNWWVLLGLQIVYVLIQLFSVWWFDVLFVALITIFIYANRPKNRGGGKKMVKAKEAVGKLWALALIAVIVVLTVGLSLAVTTFLFPETATVIGSQSTIAYLDDAIWTNGSIINWGSGLVPGNTYTKNFTVYNQGNVNATVTLLVNPPINWTETWSANNTVLTPKTSAIGSLILTVDPNAYGMPYNWNTTMLVT